MPVNLNHIVGYCLLIFKIPSNFITQVFFALFLISLFRIFIGIIKLILLKRSLTIVKMPAIVKDLAKKHNLQDRILVIYDKKPNAFCLGLRNQKIYITTSLVSLLSEEELEAVILHEKYHYKNHDTIWMLLMSMVGDFFFFIPIISDFISGVIRKNETMADQYSVQSVGGNRTLIGSFKKLVLYNSSDRLIFNYIPSFFPVHTIECRIKILKGHKPSLLPFKVSHIIITFFVITSFIVLSKLPTNRTQAFGKPSHTVCLKGETCHVDCSSI